MVTLTLCLVLGMSVVVHGIKEWIKKWIQSGNWKFIQTFLIRTLAIITHAVVIVSMIYAIINRVGIFDDWIVILAGIVAAQFILHKFKLIGKKRIFLIIFYALFAALAVAIGHPEQF